MLKNKHAKFIIVLLSTLLIIEGLYLFALPKIINIGKRTNDIEKMYAQKTGNSIKIKGLSLKTYADFSVGLRAQSISLSTKKSPNIINGDNLYVKIPLLPLIYKDLNLNYASADKLDANIERYKNGKFNVQELAFKSEKKVFDFNAKDAKCDIKKYNINFRDDALNKKVRVFGNYFKINGFTMKKFVDVETQGSIIAKNLDTKYQLKVHVNLPLIDNIDRNSFVVSGFIKDFEPTYFTPYLTKYVDKSITSTSGKLSANFYTKKLARGKKQFVLESDINNLLVTKKNSYENMSSEGNLKLLAAADFNGRIINIEKAEVAGNKFKISANGSIKDYKTKKPYLNLTAQIPDSRLENIAAILPSNLIPKRSEVKKVKKYGIFGTVNANVSVRGRLPQPNIVGYVRSNNVHVVKDLQHTHVGKIELLFKKRVLLSNVKIMLPNKQYVSVNGTTYIFSDHKNHFLIQSTKNVGMALTQKLLLPIQDVFMFQLGPIPFMHITGGTANCKLYIIGTKYDGVVKGYVGFDNVTTTYNGINGILSNGYGIVNFYGKNITYKTTKALINKNPISIFGTAIVNDTVDFNINTKNVDASTILKIVNTSPILSDLKTRLVILQKVSGPTAFTLNIKAKINTNGIMPVDPKEAMKNMKAKGRLDFHGASCVLQNFNEPISSINGSIKFTQDTVLIPNLKAKIGNSPIVFFGKIKTNLRTNVSNVDFFVKGNNIELKDSLKFLLNSSFAKMVDPKVKKLATVDAKHDFVLHYNSSAKVFDIKGISAIVTFKPQPSNAPIEILSGKIILSQGKIKLQHLNTKFYNTFIKTNGEIDNIYAKKPNFKLETQINNLDLSFLNDVSKLSFLSPQLKNLIDQNKDYSGQTNAYIKINNTKAKGYFDIKNVRFLHKKSSVPVIVDNARLMFDGDNIVAKSITAYIGKAPFYAEFTVSNIFKNPVIKGYLTTKLTDEFTDEYINPKLTYPIKVKGDISLSADFEGNAKEIAIDPTIKFNEDSDLSFMSANLGDENQLREIKASLLATPLTINVKKFEYIKFETSQNDRTYPMVFAVLKGFLVKRNGKYEVNSLFIKTNNNLPTRLLNFAFKKSIMKHGTFNCSLFYKNNPETKVPKVFGNIDFNNVDIPLYDTLIKDISINSNKDLINLDVKGTIFGSDFNISSDVANKLVYPINVEKLDISSKVFNIDKLIDTLNKMSIDSYQNKTKTTVSNAFTVSDLLIKEGSIKADNVSYKSLPANNLRANFSLDKHSIMHIKDINFDVAGGKLNGDSEYDFINNQAEATLIAKDADANDLADALFDMKNQIYGKMNGQLYLHTKGKSQDDRLNNLSGLAYFSIENGKMPKLGSLEYLLRASNLVKSGVTGLTINSIIDIVNPIKTGHFSSINGSFNIDNGVAKNIEIYSKGENLSIYVNGSYDLVNTNADMRVLGRLSKKIPTLLGPIGDTSINSLFNIIPGISLSDQDRAKFMKDIMKIPGLDFSNDDYRVFQAKIDGNINGDKYVTSFKWVE